MAAAEKKTAEFFHKNMQDSVDRMQSAFGEVERMQKKAIEQTHTSIDEVTRLMKSSVDYSFELQGHMRDLMIEATKRSMDWMAPRN
ncbi:MAG: hypothetical protein R3E66_10960 [bacterium]